MSITMAVLKKWITDKLKADTDFTALCVSTLGSELNYYRSSPMNDTVEQLPFLTAYSDIKHDDRVSGSDIGKIWNIPVVIGILSSEDSITDNDVEVWDSTDKVEIIESAMIEVLSREVRCGVSGNYNIFINDVKTMVTEIGEADDIQANVFIEFAENKNI